MRQGIFGNRYLKFKNFEYMTSFPEKRDSCYSVRKCQISTTFKISLFHSRQFKKISKEFSSNHETFKKSLLHKRNTKMQRPLVSIFSAIQNHHENNFSKLSSEFKNR